MAADKHTFLNRDLSWLSFNQRVLKEAADPSVPLYSRISFLSIFSSNLDEFFRVRMPSIFAFSNIDSKKVSLQEEYPKGLVKDVQAAVMSHQEEFGRILSQQIIPALKENGICVYYGEPAHPEHHEAMPTVREQELIATKRIERGEDSRLTFTAPADGDYIVRLKDVRGQQGEKYTYSLTIRPQQPGYSVSLRDRKLALSPGSGKEFRLLAKREDGFDGPSVSAPAARVMGSTSRPITTTCMASGISTPIRSCASTLTGQVLSP